MVKSHGWHRSNNSLKPSPLRGLGAARYDWSIANAAQRPGLAQALGGSREITVGLLIELADDEAIVLFELLASGKLTDCVDPPERNALWALEALLQKQLVAPFSENYSTLLEQARSSLVARYGS